MSTYLRKFISGCAACQAAKVNTHSTVPGLSPLAMDATTPFSSISIDLITGLPLSTGFDLVMVMVNHGLMKGVIYCPCTKEINAAGVASFFFKHVFPWFGLHSKVISDWGPQFALAFARELAWLLNYNIALSTAHHPQTDGETEWVNQELETYCISDSLQLISLKTGLSSSQWQNSLTIQLSILWCNKPQAYPPLGKTFLLNLEKWLSDLSTAQDDAQAAHRVAQQKMKERIMAKFTPWKVGEKVWLETTNLHMRGPKKSKWRGLVHLK